MELKFNIFYMIIKNKGKIIKKNFVINYKGAYSYELNFFNIDACDKRSTKDLMP